MPKQTVIIDIGHHENDSGATSNGIKEVDLNISIAKQVIKELERHNVNVVVTSGTLQNRVKVEHEVSPSYFISIHNNSGGGDGTEILVYEKKHPQLKLAENILNEITTNNLNNSRGIKERKNLYVLCKTFCPAILIECAFIDSNDIEAIDTEEERNAFGTAIAKGILKALNIDYIANTKDTYYRVSIASYKNKDTAEEMKNKLINDGYKDSFITKVEV